MHTVGIFGMKYKHSVQLEASERKMLADDNFEISILPPCNNNPCTENKVRF